jgi:hypothetical protein
MKRGCIISGGGSWGAYGGGTLAKINGNYDTIVGLSTGSLLAPLVALKEWELLKIGYTSVSVLDIFDSCWYKGKPLSNDGKIKKLPIIITLILGQKCVYTSNALRRTIDKFFTKEYFDELQHQKIEILVGTQNFAQIPSKIHYFSSMNENYEEFKDWMWCSANFPYFTSLVKKSWQDKIGNLHVGLWSDGGLTDLIGIDELMNKGFTEIDIILHRTKNINTLEGNNVYTLTNNIVTSINAMRYEIEFENFYEKIKKINRQGTKVTVYWLPRKLNSNSMIFNKEEMSIWWDEGYKTAFNPNRVEIFEPLKKRF